MLPFGPLFWDLPILDMEPRQPMAAVVRDETGDWWGYQRAPDGTVGRIKVQQTSAVEHRAWAAARRAREGS